MALTYDPIATTTLGSAAASIDFTSISGSYTDLVLVFNGKMASGEAVLMQVNGDTGTNYSATYLNGDGTSAASTRGSNSSRISLNYTGTGKTNQFNMILQFQNYSNATTYKTVLIRTSDASAEVSAVVGLWRSTSAITSIKLYGNNSANIASGTTATLYGIKAA